MAKMQVLVVGGFLGAGKTTLLAQAAKHFAMQGKRVAIITNDQAAGLVDTRLLAGLGVAVGEVAGGCFCCRFEDLERTASRLFKDVRPDVLLSEPVGSCTDISATVLRPMKRQWGEWAEVTPFSVLADPRRLRQVLDGSGKSSFPDSVRYIIKKQFEEADFIVINKADLLSLDEVGSLKDDIARVWPGAGILEISALRDWGVVEWLHAVMNIPGGGNKILDVDYDTYANGESALGWLNASVSLTAREEIDWEAFARDAIDRIQNELARLSAEIGHLKFLLANSSGQVIANVTGTGEKPGVQSSAGTCSGTTTLMVNARACVDPEALKSIVERSIIAVAGNAVDLSVWDLRSFRPAYPKPTYRIDKAFP